MKQWFQSKHSKTHELDPLCPYCESIISDYWDLNLTYIVIEVQCEDCEKSFYIGKDAPSYTTWSKE